MAYRKVVGWVGEAAFNGEAGLPIIAIHEVKE